MQHLERSNKAVAEEVEEEEEKKKENNVEPRKHSCWSFVSLSVYWQYTLAT